MTPGAAALYARAELSRAAMEHIRAANERLGAVPQFAADSELWDKVRQRLTANSQQRD